MAIEFIKYKDVENKITNQGIEIINVYADWCGPCRMLAPVLEEVSSDYKVFKINLDENKDDIQKEEIKGIPYTKILKNGEVIKEFNGYLPKEKIIEIIKS